MAMTVADLIDALAEMDLDAPVLWRVDGRVEFVGGVEECDAEDEDGTGELIKFSGVELIPGSRS